MATSRTSKAALQRFIQQSPLPVYLVMADMKITYANAATGTWVGLDDESITELTCVYNSSADQPPSNKIASGLCPPPDSFDGAPQEFFVYKPTSAGCLEFRRAIACPLAGAATGTLVTVFGESREHPDPILDQQPLDNTRLHAAIAEMQYETALQINLDLVVGNSSVADKIRRQIDVAGQTSSSLLITGPPGSGRSKIAQLIHFAHGPAMAGPLIPIDCTVVDAEGLQTLVKELYREQRQNPDEPLGRLLLQDVDCLVPPARDELMGFLTLPDFRLPLLATGSQDCRAGIDPDLWRKLSTLVIELPALTERCQDIPFLLQAVLEQGNESGSPQFSGFDSLALDYLTQYNWPGQLDELADVVKLARSRATPPTVNLDDLPAHVRIAVNTITEGTDEPQRTIDLDQFLADIETELIERAVGQAGGNKSQAARLLGISRARLLRRLNDESAENAGTPEDIENDSPDAEDQLQPGKTP